MQKNRATGARDFIVLLKEKINNQVIGIAETVGHQNLHLKMAVA